ncbi:hypothetical protein IC575_004893 [Cucumis melo]
MEDYRTLLEITAHFTYALIRRRRVHGGIPVEKYAFSLLESSVKKYVIPVDPNS